MDPEARAKAKLIALLQRAYSGERAAFHAYEGHWRSVRDPAEAARIKAIAAEEVDHRERVGAMLEALGAQPGRVRECVFLLIGLVIRLLCRVGGWFGGLGWYAAMDGAGRLEAGNVGEYVTAAELARAAGLAAFAPDLMHMAFVEWEHEVFFFERCASHGLSRYAPSWTRPGRPEAQEQRAAS
jgi:hypothetical protein